MRLFFLTMGISEYGDACLIPKVFFIHRKKRSVLLVLVILQCVGVYLLFEHCLPVRSFSLFQTDIAVRFPWKPSKTHDVECSKLFNDDHAEQQRAKNITRKIPPDRDVTDEVNEIGCDAFLHKHGFITSPLTDEERGFPLAYSVVVYKHAAQLGQLLQAIYRPQNVICIHVDQKSTADFHKAVQAVIGCLDNVFLSSRSVKVTWGTFSVLEPELICMEDLLQHKGWRYFINLTGQEYPLKTNLEIVQILKAMKGANLVVGDNNSFWQKQRWQNKAPAPHNLTVFKGAVHVAVNRHFVDFAVNSQVARDFKKWCQNITIPDEQFFPTLNHNPHLRVPGSYAGTPTTNASIKPNLVRFKNWRRPTCTGKIIRGICILSSGDLPVLGRRVELFANKFHAGYSSLALECLAERLYNHTREEALGQRKFNTRYYESLPFLENIVRGDSA